MTMIHNRAITSMRAVEQLLGASTVDAPAELLGALDAYVAAQIDPEPIDLARECLTVKADAVPELHIRAAERETLRAAVPPVRAEVTGLIARRVVAAFLRIAPAVFDELGVTFTAAVPAFTNALGRLPERLDLETIARTGSGQLSAYEAAQEAARDLDAIASRRDALASLGYAAGGVDPVVEPRTRFASFTDPEAYARFVGTGKAGPFGWWTTCVRTTGVELRWQTLDEQRATAEMLRPPVRVRT